MIIGQQLPYDDSTTPQTMWGASRAVRELSEAWIRHGSRVDELNYFLRSTNDCVAASPALTRLQALFPERRIACYTIKQIPERVQQSEYVFPVPQDSVHNLLWLRTMLGSSRFATNWISHAIPDHGAIGRYLTQALLARPCDTIVATSLAAQQALENLYDLAIRVLAESACCAPIQKPSMTHIPLGVEVGAVERHSPILARERLSLDLQADTQVVLYIGRIDEQFKADLEPLLLTWRRIVSKRAELDLVLVVAGSTGRSTYHSKITELVQELGITGQVRFLLNFEERQRSDLYNACDVFISPVDNIQESFGLAVLDAMSHARPVIVSDWSGYRDLVEDKVNGLLVPTYWGYDDTAESSCLAAFAPALANAEIARSTIVDVAVLEVCLLALLDSPETARQMGEAGLKRAQRLFDWPIIVQQYEELWTEQMSILLTMPEREIDKSANHTAIFGHYASQKWRDLSFRQSSQEILNTGYTEAPPLSLRVPAGGVISNTSQDYELWLAKKGLGLSSL